MKPINILFAIAFAFIWGSLIVDLLSAQQFFLASLTFLVYLAFVFYLLIEDIAYMYEKDRNENHEWY